MSDVTATHGVNEVRGIRRWLVQALGRLVHHWQRTFSYVGVKELEAALGAGGEEPLLILVWHNRLFHGIGALAAAGGCNGQLHGLVSASKDGALLSVFLEQQGILPIRGSSSRRGADASRELFSVLRMGGSVAITVDGPRGPRYIAQAGAAMLLRTTKVPVLFIGAEAENAFSLNSWDGFVIPRPFSRVHVFCRRYASVPEAVTGKGKEGREQTRMWLQHELTSLTRDCHLAESSGQ